MTVTETENHVEPTIKKRIISFQELADCLQNTSGQESLPPRFRALFALKNIGGSKAIEAISGAFKDPSVLLKHELAYVLGQMKDVRAHPVLNRILQDENEDSMVRHEAAEALGAIGSPLSLPILEAYLDHKDPAVRETCEIAVDRIKKADYKNEVLAPGEIVFGSVDPAPSLSQKDLTVEQLGDRLMDTSAPLYERYKAMFSLRNRGQQEDAVLALCRGFQDESALFRHEIAYVLGQLQHPASIPALAEALRRPNEAGMVRHESAEALGSIASPECFEILNGFENDPEDVVRESCQVALDMYDYENSDEMLFFPMREDSDAEEEADN